MSTLTGNTLRKVSKFDSPPVSRIDFKSEYGLEISVDINSEIFPIAKDETYQLRLVRANQDSEASSDYYSITQNEQELINESDYMMHGRIFKYDIKGDFM